jgi:hypothetical protein
MKVLIEWPGMTNTKTGGWDSAEVTLEMSDEPITVSAFVGQVAGPDGRWVATIDVEE